MRIHRSTPALLGLLLVASAVPQARAGLGDPATAIARDRVALRADAVTTTTMVRFVRHELVTEDGAIVHEFAAPGGPVFAVAFSGPTIPDMKTMLGSHYDDYLASARAHRGNHHVMSFDENGIVVSIVKLPRGFTGSAHVPALMPQGVAAEDLR